MDNFESKTNYNILIPALIEANLRKDKIIAELTKRVTFLEVRTLIKAGRPKTRFYFNGQELTDEYLVYLIDYDYITIRKLEKDVGAGKNQLRKYDKYCKVLGIIKKTNHKARKTCLAKIADNVNIFTHIL